MITIDYNLIQKIIHEKNCACEIIANKNNNNDLNNIKTLLNQNGFNLTQNKNNPQNHIITKILHNLEIELKIKQETNNVWKENYITSVKYNGRTLAIINNSTNQMGIFADITQLSIK